MQMLKPPGQKTYAQAPKPDTATPQAAGNIEMSGRYQPHPSIRNTPLALVVKGVMSMPDELVYLPLAGKIPAQKQLARLLRRLR
jgi:hypothetical protein